MQAAQGLGYVSGADTDLFDGVSLIGMPNGNRSRYNPGAGCAE
jgi:hypothetical protein